MDKSKSCEFVQRSEMGIFVSKCFRLNLSEETVIFLTHKKGRFLTVFNVWNEFRPISNAFSVQKVQFYALYVRKLYRKALVMYCKLCEQLQV